MSFIGDAVGSVVGGVENAFGAKNNYNAKGVPLLQGATTDQANQAYAQGQGLTGRQTSVADMLQARARGANPINFGAANATLGQGNDLLSQLVAQGNGQGPNPALAQLQQATSQNIGNAAGMAASARGINPALAARMAVNSAATANQGAAGQAAILNAQQELAARAQAAGLVGQQAGLQANMAQAQAGQQATNTQQLLQQLGTMGGQNLSQQQILQQALAGYNQANVSQNLGVRDINAGVAKQNAQLGAQILGGAMQGFGAAGAQGAAGAGAGGGAASLAPEAAMAVAHGGEITRQGVRRGRTDKEVAQEILARRAQRLAEGGEAEQPPGAAGGLLNSLAQWWHTKTEPAGREVAEQIDRKLPEAVGAQKAVQQNRTRLDAAYRASQSDAHGGVIRSRDKQVAAQLVMHRYFAGGRARRYDVGGVARSVLGGIGSALSGIPNAVQPASQPAAPVPAPTPYGPSSFVGRLLEERANGPRPYAPMFANVLSRGGMPRPVFMSRGVPEVVPGRAAVPERVDSESADRVPAWLSPGEGVLPRSVMQADDAPEKAADFVAHLVKRRGPSGYKRVAEARKRAGERR